MVAAADNDIAAWVVQNAVELDTWGHTIQDIKKTEFQLNKQ